MDTNSVKQVNQLKRYYKLLEKYEKSKQALHVRQSRGLGGSDKEAQRMLQRMGLDVASLIQDSQIEAQKLTEAHKAFLDFVRPPTLPDNNVLQIPPNPNVCDVHPPAIAGFVSIPENCSDCGLNLQLGEINFKMSQKGDGWGLSGQVGMRRLITLVFQFIPPRAGNVQVDAYVDFKGQFAVSAHDHWYTSTHAYLDLSVSSKLYQHYWENGPSVVVLHEDRTESSNSGWVDRYVKLSCTTSISANDPVLISVQTDCSIVAQSSHARVDVDFATGAERRVRVPVIRFRYF